MYFLERRQRILNDDCIPEELLIEDNEFTDDNFQAVTIIDDNSINTHDTKGIKTNFMFC